MSEASNGVRAWDDRTTRRAVRRYGLRALGAAVLSLPLVLLGSQFVDANGDTKEGIPTFVPGAFFVVALLALSMGVLSLGNWLRLRWTLARWPWQVMRSRLQEMKGFGTPNGQPVLTLDANGRQQVLTLAVLRWRWQRFDQSQLLVCGRPGRGAVIATLDKTAIGWAGRSPFTALARRFRRQRPAAR